MAAPPPSVSTAAAVFASFSIVFAAARARRAILAARWRVCGTWSDSGRTRFRRFRDTTIPVTATAIVEIFADVPILIATAVVVIFADVPILIATAVVEIFAEVAMHSSSAWADGDSRLKEPELGVVMRSGDR
jgi:hypothetical protein